MSRIAALSDIHGNAAALEAVLADISKERPDGPTTTAGEQLLAGHPPRAVT